MPTRRARKPGSVTAAPASPALFGEGAVYTALLSSAGIAAATGSPLAAPAGEFFFLAQTDIIFDPKLVQK